jgi:glycosyltransferase involved in cell wall biosynthesis
MVKSLNFHPVKKTGGAILDVLQPKLEVRMRDFVIEASKASVNELELKVNNDINQLQNQFQRQSNVLSELQRQYDSLVLTVANESALERSTENRLIRELEEIYQGISEEKKRYVGEQLPEEIQVLWREELRRCIAINARCQNASEHPSRDECNKEFRTLLKYSKYIEPVMNALRSKRVFFSGQCYYNNWYLSRELRNIGWKADLYNWSLGAANQIFYHGQDIQLIDDGGDLVLQEYNIFLNSIYAYDVVHFSNAYGINYGSELNVYIASEFAANEEIFLLKSLGKKLVYTNNGCLDGVSQLSFSRWGDEPICNLCRWQDEPLVCNNKKNLDWGYFKKRVIDYQCLLGGNRVDFNSLPTVHESPEAYCLDADIWRPDIVIPAEHTIGTYAISQASRNGRDAVVNLYHAVGKNIKSTNIYLPLIEKLKAQGLRLTLTNPKDMPNLTIRYYQLQSDIVLEMLEYGWFGANAREAMMLGVPVICYIRPEWLESLRAELPEYANELPIVSATPDTIETVLTDLIENPLKRAEIGKRSREFMMKWHDSKPAAQRMDAIYTKLLANDRLLFAKNDTWKT